MCFALHNEQNTGWGSDTLQAALSRNEAGTYGVCATCGEAISPARLEAMPIAWYYMRCQERIE